MCKLFIFSNILGLIGSWLVLILTLGIYYFVWIIYEYFYQKKYSSGHSLLRISRTAFLPLSPSYWFSRRLTYYE